MLLILLACGPKDVTPTASGTGAQLAATLGTVCHATLGTAC